MGAIRNEPTMNINGQVNKALNDIRLTLMSHRDNMEDMARFQLDCALEMVRDHLSGKASTPWSDIRVQIIEEFS